MCGLFFFYIVAYHVSYSHLWLFSLGCSIVTFMASYENYPGGYALKALHQSGKFTLCLSVFFTSYPSKLSISAIY